MSNYTTRTYKVRDTFHCDVTVDCPFQDRITKKIVEFKNKDEQELDYEVTKFIVHIKNNL